MTGLRAEKSNFWGIRCREKGERDLEGFRETWLLGYCQVPHSVMYHCPLLPWSQLGGRCFSGEMTTS